MFNKKKIEKRMNKSAVFWFEFFSKRFGPGPSSVEVYNVPWGRDRDCNTYAWFYCDSTEAA